MKGLVLRSTGSFYEVLAEDGSRLTCKVRGKIRLEGIKETNPVAVGDWVRFEKNDEVGSIMEILPRTNHMLRQSIKKTSHSHVLAANIDQVMLIATLAYPRTSFGFIDRFFVAAESFRIPQVLIFNKKDLLQPEDAELQEAFAAIYRKIGVIVLSISALTEDHTFIRALLQDKITLISGHSGVGKSTLLNKIAPHLNQKTGEISDFSEKGMHTTTFAEMFPLDTKTFVIDTPGIKEWGLVDMEDQELSDYFPEMRVLRQNCKFASRCLHMNEPRCAVIDAVKSGAISISRYESYLSILAGEDNRR
jgi:ribosome biogenesis GTPase